MEGHGPVGTLHTGGKITLPHLPDCGINETVEGVRVAEYFPSGSRLKDVFANMHAHAYTHAHTLTHTLPPSFPQRRPGFSKTPSAG